MRFRTNDLPAQGVGAFMPIPAISAPSSSWGQVERDGAPGTEPSPSPAPQRDYLPPLSARAGKDAAQGSEVAPDVMLFSRYTAFADNMGPANDGLGMTRRRFNELPVPAFDPIRIGRAAFQPAPRLGGRTQVTWPRAFQRFPLRGQQP